MTGANLAGTPVWAAALCAAACQTWRSVGEWLSTPKCILYAATDEVPFGIALAQGEILEVRWSAGDTGYSVAVRQP